MTTTTVRLDDELKLRINRIAGDRGTSQHAFIVDAIESKLAEAEAELEFGRIAGERWQRVLETGKTVALDDAAAWITSRAQGVKMSRPRPRVAR